MTPTITEAIEESIATTSVVRVSTTLKPHSLLPFIQSIPGVEDVDHAVENDGTWDVWGDRGGDQFRIRVKFI